MTVKKNWKDLKATNLKFASKITVEGFFRITDKYRGKIPNSFHFWYKYSDFGKFFLKNIYVGESENLDQLITKKTWYKYIPILKRFFLTYKEYYTIIRNVHYLNGTIPYSGAEDGDFMLYTLTRVKPYPFDLLKLDYKRFFKLYLYNFGDNYLTKITQGEDNIYG